MQKLAEALRTVSATILVHAHLIMAKENKLQTATSNRME